MTELTVREALTLDGLRRVEVRAGRAGLDRTITCVNVMEVPDILQWVRGGELLLTTMYPLKDARLSPRELVPLLNDRGLAAIAIKPHRYLDEIPDEMLEAADAVALPVLELPSDASFVDLINVVLTRILNYQAETLLRSEEIHRRFTSVVLEGGGLAEIAGLLSNILDKPVAIYAAGGDLLASSPAAPTPGPTEAAGAGGDPPLQQLLQSTPDAPPPHQRQGMGRVQDPAGQTGFTHRSIRTGRLHFGEIIVWDAGEPLKETDLMAVDHASTVAALALSKSRAVSEVELRYRNDFLNDLLSGNIHDRGALPARAESFGWRLHPSYSVVVVEFEGLHNAYEPVHEVQPGSDLEAAHRLRLLADTALRLDPETIAWTKIDSIVFLCPLPARAGKEEARKRSTWLATQLRQHVLPDDSHACTWGIGGFYPDLLDLHKAYSEARLAAAMGRLVGRPGELNHYEDMGVYRLLHRFPEEGLLEFATEALRPVLNHDARHGGQLLATMEAYLACERNMAHTARRLDLHYNTVRYRVQRADRLLAGALHNPDKRLELELAIKALRLHGR
jgi:purine catabolism regulator